MDYDRYPYTDPEYAAGYAARLDGKRTKWRAPHQQDGVRSAVWRMWMAGWYHADFDLDDPVDADALLEELGV